MLTTDITTRPKPTELCDRELREQFSGGPNAHRYWYRARNHLDGPILGPLRITLNYLVIYASKHLPSLTFKRFLFRRLGMRLGSNVTISSGVTLDYFFPEQLEIGDNTIVGMDAMILTHEFLHDRFRIGSVKIGSNCLIAARSTVLAGVTIKDGTTVAAMSLVNKGVPANCLVAGIPIRIVRHSAQELNRRSPCCDKA